jgi:hypothetical protein
MGMTANEVRRIGKAQDYPNRRDLASARPAHPRQDRHPITTFYAELDRYTAGGFGSLDDRKPWPKRVWNRIPDETRARIIERVLEEPELSPREVQRSSMSFNQMGPVFS